MYEILSALTLLPMKLHAASLHIFTSCPNTQLQFVFFITILLSVFLQISAQGPFIDVVEVKSCGVFPVSDPKKSHFWTVISDGCSSDPSVTLGAKTKDEEEKEAEGDGELEEEKDEIEELEKGRTSDKDQEAPARVETSSTSVGSEEEVHPLRFSFILQPVYNNSVQFLQCSLRLCVSDSTRGEPTKETVKNGCQGGLRIPPLVSRSAGHQVQEQFTH